MLPAEQPEPDWLIKSAQDPLAAVCEQGRVGASYRTSAYFENPFVSYDRKHTGAHILGEHDAGARRPLVVTFQALVVADGLIWQIALTEGLPRQSYWMGSVSVTSTD